MKVQKDAFASLYPNIARWVEEWGWVEIGSDENLPSFVKAVNDGGLIWEGKAKYPTFDAALKALDAGIAAWLRDMGEDEADAE